MWSHSMLFALEPINRHMNILLEDGAVVQTHIPSGILDFGLEVLDNNIMLVTSRGDGYGKGLVYSMCGIPHCGSRGLKSHLPKLPTCELERIIIYPLLLHALKNYTSMKWSSVPKTIKCVKKKAKAFHDLLGELAGDRRLGGCRVEIRCKGHAYSTKVAEQGCAVAGLTMAERSC